MRLNPTPYLSHWSGLRHEPERYSYYLILCARAGHGRRGETIPYDRATQCFDAALQATRKTLMAALIKYDRTQLARIREVAEAGSPRALVGMDAFEATLTTATAMRLLNELITPEMLNDVMLLANNPLGFMTDRQPGAKDRNDKPLAPYGPDTVKRCFIEATLRGARSVGNEWNIISGRAYLTRNYFERALRDYPGLTCLRLKPSVPVMRTGGAIVKFAASWKLNGTPDAIEREIAVRVNSGMGTDAILGKADRKMRAAIFNHLTGTVWDTDDSEAVVDSPAAADPNVIETTAVPSDEQSSHVVESEPEPTTEPEPEQIPEAAAVPERVEEMPPPEPAAPTEEPTLPPAKTPVADMDEKPEPPPPPRRMNTERLIARIKAATTQEELDQLAHSAGLALDRKELSLPDWQIASAEKKRRANALRSRSGSPTRKD